jgi:hypothetical protein
LLRVGEHCFPREKSAAGDEKKKCAEKSHWS